MKKNFADLQEGNLDMIDQMSLTLIVNGNVIGSQVQYPPQWS